MPSTKRQTPVELYLARRRLITSLIALLVVVVVGAFVYWRYMKETPVVYADIEEHFKYGSIGADIDSGFPYWLWQVLPEMFPQYLPDPEAFLAIPANQRSAIDAYTQFGFLHEEGRELPIGFSQRRLTLDRVGLNCAICHVGTVRKSEGMDVERIYDSTPAYLTDADDRVIILGMPSNSVNLQAYFEFLFDTALDADFTADKIMAAIGAKTRLDPIESFLYRQSVPIAREALLTRRQELIYMEQVPRFGPGRIDTFNPYKAHFYGLPYDGTIGVVDLPSMWNQRPRVGMQLHWDGDSTSVFERNLSAALGIGATPESLDFPSILRVAAWIGAPDREVEEDEALRAALIPDARNNPVPAAGELPVPAFPFEIDPNIARTGEAIYLQQCAVCHDWQGAQVGKVVPIDEIGTDPSRLNSFTEEYAPYQNAMGTGYWWRFKSFSKTNGYANMPLDGLWARAPYLHNGSVPTLRDLLNRPEMRPQSFYRGDDEYDPIRVGFRTDRAQSPDGQQFFLLDTTLPGNSNSGHLYGVDLSDEEKEALVEFLKTR